MILSFCRSISTRRTTVGHCACATSRSNKRRQQSACKCYWRVVCESYLDGNRLDSHCNGDCPVCWTGVDDTLETVEKCPTEKVSLLLNSVWLLLMCFGIWLDFRLTAHSALIEESTNNVDPQSPLTQGSLIGGGNDNLAFEKDGGKQEKHQNKSTLTKTGRPVIHFPNPPIGSPTSRYILKQTHFGISLFNIYIFQSPIVPHLIPQFTIQNGAPAWTSKIFWTSGQLIYSTKNPPNSLPNKKTPSTPPLTNGKNESLVRNEGTPTRTALGPSKKIWTICQRIAAKIVSKLRLNRITTTP